MEGDVLTRNLSHYLGHGASSRYPGAELDLGSVPDWQGLHPEDDAMLNALSSDLLRIADDGYAPDVHGHAGSCLQVGELEHAFALVLTVRIDLEWEASRLPPELPTSGRVRGRDGQMDQRHITLIGGKALKPYKDKVLISYVV